MKYHAFGVARLLVLSGLLASSLICVSAQNDVPPGIARLLDGADVVIVGTTERSEPLWHENDRGDRIIVSRTLLNVNETMKGEAESMVWIDLEGGTIDGVTMRASSSPELRIGDRSVFFLQRSVAGAYVLLERGRGVLKLDSRNIISGTTISLDDIRQAAHARGQGTPQ